MTAEGSENPPDLDPIEVVEWQDSIEAVIREFGEKRAHQLLYHTSQRAQELGAKVDVVSSPYQNTIPVDSQSGYPGDLALEKEIHKVNQWNAMMIVTKANKNFDGIGGHISTYASVSHLWEVGFNHFFKGKHGEGFGDHVYWQGHASPGIYARAFLEGRLSEEQLLSFRQETGGNGLSSYPHPRLMPTFWEYPTVSMGLGTLTAIHQARFNRYLSQRGLIEADDGHIWYTMGDGESDEPESLSSLSLAAREGLDNITIILNCNLQRLDGPVRGNAKIIQELEGRFRGAGWNVIKLIWGSSWDELFARDDKGILARRLENLVDGDEQRIFTADGETIRKDLFHSPELQAMVSHLTDKQLELLCADVGGHDFVKIYSAFEAAKSHKGQPTVILARTVKGWGLGDAFAGRNTTHQKKKAELASLEFIRDRMNLSFSNEELEQLPFVHPSKVPEMVTYAKGRRDQLHGPCPERLVKFQPLESPDSSVYSEFDQGTKGSTEVSTTMAFVRLLRSLMKSKAIGSRIVPLIPDEARTFGMDPLFAEFGIYHPEGQLYKPVDHKVLMKYKESEKGQILEEGINEAGAMASFIASATSYANQSCPTIPFYTFYSMFGFQRVGDLIWSAADSRARGFLIGATSGRTTLNGEGLQHQDGHSLLIAHTNPAVKAWDPAFAYELSTIIEHGINEMYGEDKDVLHYIAVYNENYPMPKKPEGVDEGIIKGLYMLRQAPQGEGPVVRLIGSGPIMLQVLAAVEMLEDLGIRSEIWSATSYGELRREAAEMTRWNRHNPDQTPRISWVEQMLGNHSLPTIAVSDNIAAVPDLIRPWVDDQFISLGTDGFGRSDLRENLRSHFEIDANHITLNALSLLVKNGDIEKETFSKFKQSLQ